MSSSIFIRCLVSFLNFPLSIFVSVVNFVTKNQEIGNTPIWVLPNIWRLRRVSDTKFGSDEMLPNAAKCQVYSFYRFWVIKGKPTGQGGNCPPPPTTTTTQIRVNKVADLRPEILCKKRLRPRSFSVNFAVFLRTSFIQNTSGRLHVTMYIIQKQAHNILEYLESNFEIFLII